LKEYEEYGEWYWGPEDKEQVIIKRSAAASEVGVIPKTERGAGRHGATGF